MSISKRTNYLLDHDSPAPVMGQYLVTIGRKGVLSVMLIKTVRKIQHKTVNDYQGYHLEMIDRPDLKPYTEIERFDGGAEVWVRGEVALPCFWIPRSKKT